MTDIFKNKHNFISVFFILQTLIFIFLSAFVRGAGFNLVLILISEVVLFGLFSLTKKNN